MLEGIVRRLLVDRFGRFVHGVDDARLSSGLTSGQLLLSNLRLKEAAAEVLGLAPAFDLRHGTISKMRVDLPGITSLASKPVTVRIEDVFLLLVAAPSDTDKTDLLKQAKSKARAKKLHDIETAMGNILLELGGMMARNSSNQSGGFLKSLIPITVILANLKIEIVNIHVRCEDDSATHPGYSFAFGITTQRIQLRAVNDQGQDIFISESVDVSRRKVDLSNFAFYWDCDINPESNPLWALEEVPDEEEKNVDSDLTERMRSSIAVEESFSTFDKIRRECFIVAPASASCFVQINSNLVDFNISRCTINCLVPNLQLHIRSKQLRDAKSIVNYQVSMQKRIAAAEVLLRLQSRRPTVPNAKAWWRYAVHSILELIRSRNDLSYGDMKSSLWNWFAVESIGNDRRLYLELYSKRLRVSEPKQPKLRRVKTLAEPKKSTVGSNDDSSEKLTESEEANLQLLEDRLPLNLIVLLRSLVHQNHMVEQVIKEKVEIKNSPGYFSWMFAGGPEGAETDLSEDQKLAIRQEADIISRLETSTAPNDFELIHVDFQTRVVCTLHDSHSGHEERAIASSDVDISLQFIQYPHSTATKLLIQHLRISDLTAPEPEPLTVLSMHRSSEQSGTVLELFLETWEVRSVRNLDLNVKLTIETTKIVWSGVFFRQFFHFLHAGYGRNTLMLFDGAFWEWTEMQQSFLMSAFSKQRKHRIEAQVGVVNVIFITDDSETLAFAFRSLSVFSEPITKCQDLFHASLSQFQISIRLGEGDDVFVILNPVSLEMSLKLCSKASDTSTVDISVPSISIAFNLERIRALVKIITHFASTLFVALSRQSIISSEITGSVHSPLKKHAMFPAISLIVPSMSFNSKPHVPSTSTGPNIGFRCSVGILTISSEFCLRLASVELFGTLSSWILQTDGVCLYNPTNYRYGWVAQSHDQHQGEKICVAFDSASNGNTCIIFGMRQIAWQWSPFYIQSLFDFATDLNSALSELTSKSPSSPKTQAPIQNKSCWRCHIFLENCTWLFNKRHNRLALLNVANAEIHYFTNPYSIVIKFFKSAVRDMSMAALKSTAQTDILYADLIDMKVTEGDPSLHWAAISARGVGCKFVYFHRQIQELCDYISNGLTGIVFGFNPDKKDQWPDFSPVLHGTFCAASIDFPDVEILLPACNTGSSIRRREGLTLVCKNIHISNSAFADLDGWRTAEWKVELCDLTIRSLVKKPISGQITAKFSTDARCNRVPWLTIIIGLSSVDIFIDDPSATRSGRTAILENLAEAWVEPVQFPGEPEYHWFLDDILTETGSSIRIDLSLQSLSLFASSLLVNVNPVHLVFDRNSNWSMNLLLRCLNFCTNIGNVEVAKLLPEGCLALQYYISGDFQQSKTEFSMDRFLVSLESSSLGSLSSALPSISKYSALTLAMKTALSVHSLQEISFSDRSDYWIPSFIITTELEFDGDSTLLIAVPAIAIAIVDVLRDSKFVHGLSHCLNASNVLRSCCHWPFLTPSQLFIILRDSSAESLLSVLHTMATQVLARIPARDTIADPVQLHELTSNLKPHEFGFLVYITSLSTKYMTASVNILSETYIGPVLLDYWKRNLWPLCQRRKRDIERSTSEDDLALMWSSPSCPKQNLVLSDRIELQIPTLLFTLLTAIKERIADDPHSTASQFRSALTILFQSPLQPKSVLGPEKRTSVNAPAVIAFLLHILRCQHDPIIPFQFQYRSTLVNQAIIQLSSWSRYVLLSIAHLISSVKVTDSDTVCNIVSSAMLWTEPIAIGATRSALSDSLLHLARCFTDNNYQYIHAVLNGNRPKQTQLLAKTEFILLLLPVIIDLVVPNQSAMRISSRMTASADRSPNGSQRLSVIFHSLELCRLSTANSNPDSGKHRLLFLNDPNEDSANECRLTVESGAEPNATDLLIRTGNVSSFLCAEDYYQISTVCKCFMAAVPATSSKSPATSSKSPSANGKVSVRLDLQSLSMSLCSDYSRDPLFMMSLGLDPLFLTYSSPTGIDQCSFSAWTRADFLHPKVAVWEPVVEPFNIQFSWHRDEIASNEKIADSPSSAAVTPSSASNLIKNATNTVQILVHDPIRVNLSPDTISSLASFLTPHRNASAPLLTNSSCAFTLRNFTGLPLTWDCSSFSGVLEDMMSTSLECLGSNPWEPAHTLSLTVGTHWLPIRNAYVGNVGAFQFALIPASPGDDHRMPQDGLVLETLIENGHAVLSAHSSVGYFNCTALLLRIVLFNGNLQHELDLDPLQTRWSPLLYCAWDAFSIGVVEDGDSVRQLGRLSLSALRRKRRSEHVFCVGGDRYVFLCAASGGLWPGRLAITVRAPLDIRNRLPYPIDVKFDNDIIMRIEDGSKKQIETIDGSNNVHLLFSMQGFEWSNPIAVFAEKSHMDDGRRTTMTVPIQDRFGATLYVVVDIARIIAVDDDQSKLNGRALFRVTLYTRLWLLNHIPGVELLFGSSKGVILPGQGGRQIVDYVYENQRWYPGKGWSAKLLPGDRPAWSDIDGRPATLSSVQLPGPDWSWVDSGWTVDTDPVETDDDGWAFAKNFSKTFHAEHKKKYLVRRRRYSRARILTMNEAAVLPICMFSPGGRKQLTSRYSTSHISVKTNKSDWSAPINLLHGTDTRVLTLFTHDFGRILDLGIHISPCHPPYRDTWLASFVPRYIIWNSFSQTLSNVCVQQFSDSFNICIIRPGKQKAFFFNRIPFETEKSIRSTYVRVGATFNGSMYWSCEFDINCVGLHVLRVSNSNSNDDHRILQLQISLHKASVILYISESDPSRPRYSIRNELSAPVIVSQSNSPTNLFGRIDPNQVYTSFAWDLLSVKDRLLCVKLEDARFDVEIDSIGAISTLTNSVFVSVFADGDTNVVLITSSESRAKRLAQVYGDDSSGSKPDHLLKITVHIEEALLSLISLARTELMLIALLSSEATVTHSTHFQNIEITLDSFRIDNQLYLEQNSAFTFPNVIYSESSPSHSFVWFQCTRSFHTSDMRYFKLFDLAIQPFVVNLEETYIVTVLEFIRSVQKEFGSDASKQHYDAFNLDPVSPSFGISQLMYFEVLRTPTIKMQLSVRKAQESLSHEYLRERIGLAHLLGVLLTNLEAKPIRRPGHEYVRLCDRTSSLREQLLADYKGSLLMEFLASFGYNKLALGGVVPILSTFRAGVRDFRKEIQSSLKQGNITGGLSRGTFSLVDHTARGLMMPITGLSAGFGDVISALTFDKDFTSRRALDVGNKPLHVVDGIIRGGRSLGLGILNGVAALVREPVKNYHRHPGGIGVAVGIGKGVAQAVASPIVGVFDAINHIGTGIARTPDYFRRRSSLIQASAHFRLPRAFYGPGRSIRIYNPVDALIVDTLHSVKPAIDATIHHVFIGGLMNDVRAYAVLIRGIAAFQISQDRHAAKLLWFIAWSSIKTFELIEHGIRIFSVSGVDNKDSSWLLIWLSQPGPAYDIIMATHSRYKAALRVRSKPSLIPHQAEDADEAVENSEDLSDV